MAVISEVLPEPLPPAIIRFWPFSSILIFLFEFIIVPEMLLIDFIFYSVCELLSSGVRREAWR